MPIDPQSHVAGSKLPSVTNVMGKVRDPGIGARPAAQAALNAEWTTVESGKGARRPTGRSTS
jgi:hypothetical protein